MPVGYLSIPQMLGLADLAERYGAGDVRLTVWQNVLIPDIPDAHLAEFSARLRELGLRIEATNVTGGLVACTGSQGCKFAQSDTKRHAIEIGDPLRERIDLDYPINIHLTGCPHSCAQHYIGDIGLVGVKVKREGESVDGYNMVVGGGVDDEQGIGRELMPAIAASELPNLIEHMLRRYLDTREGTESFLQFTRRHDIDTLKNLFFDHVSAA